MALNLIIEKNIEIKDEEIINLFNIVLTISDLDKSDKDLFKIKKALFLSKENQNEEKIRLKALRVEALFSIATDQNCAHHKQQCSSPLVNFS